MPATVPSHLLYCASHPGNEIHSLLDHGEFVVRTLDFPLASSADLAPFDLLLIDATEATEQALRLCHTLRSKQGERLIPILMLIRDASPQTRLASLNCGADSYILHPFEPAELLAQVQSFLRIKERHDHLLVKTAEVHRINKRLQAAYQQIDHELELARRIQESFLPQSLPQVPRVRLAVKYRPCGRVGGDFYDVFRLDENHLGLYVADAMGHGVPASLLTIFVKKGVRPKEIQGKDYRLIPPGEVLGKLNRDLIDQALSDQPFVTMVYALFNFREGVFQFSRSGHPYPLYLPREGPPQLWQIEGSLLGVFESQYPIQTHQLQEGDKILFYTDGLDAASFDNQPVGMASLLAAAENFRQLPIDELIERLATDLFGQTQQSDDLTILGLEFGGASNGVAGQGP
jgi:sigma-B regulation protein RsbU (phosphoserine phosphatase)